MKEEHHETTLDPRRRARRRGARPCGLLVRRRWRLHGGAKTYVDGATFTMTVAGDAGKLDPQLSPDNTLNQLTQFAYDPLVSIDDKGDIHAQLASDWKVDGTTLTFTLKDGITCADGSPFTAETAAENIAFVADPATRAPSWGLCRAGNDRRADGSTSP